NTNGTVIDSIYYNANFGATVKNISAERKDPERATNDPSNWTASISEQGFTPGTENSNYQTDKKPPEISFAKLLKNGNISVRFNEFIAKSSDLKFKINDKPADIVAFDGAKGNKVILDGSEVTGGKPITVKALEVIDIVGNKTPLTQLAVSQPLRKNDVVINEIMFAPIRNSDSGMNQSEYVELYNRRDYAISLEGISLHKAPDSRG